jgi:hypothetical protein
MVTLITFVFVFQAVLVTGIWMRSASTSVALDTLADVLQHVFPTTSSADDASTRRLAQMLIRLHTHIYVIVGDKRRRPVVSIDSTASLLRWPKHIYGYVSGRESVCARARVRTNTCARTECLLLSIHVVQ